MKAVSGVLLAAVAAMAAVGTVQAEPLSGVFTGVVESSTAYTNGQAASGTFSIDPLGCPLGITSGTHSEGCAANNGVALSIAVAGNATLTANDIDSFVTLSQNANSLEGETETASGRGFAYILLDGAAGAFGMGQDYSTLQPGDVTGGTVYYQATNAFAEIALTSVTFDQAITAVPETSSVALLAGGLSIALALARRRRRG